MELGGITFVVAGFARTPWPLLMYAVTVLLVVSRVTRSGTPSAFTSAATAFEIGVAPGLLVIAPNPPAPSPALNPSELAGAAHTAKASRVPSTVKSRTRTFCAGAGAATVG